MNLTIVDFISDVRSVIEHRVTGALSGQIDGIDIAPLLPGKMLRARLAGRLLASLDGEAELESVRAACAAAELVHTASLCHDDVVDNSLIRRSLPTLWRTTSPSGAILIGDLLLCEAMSLLVETEKGRYLPAFISMVTQVVQAEAEQELVWRGKRVDAETCLRLARGKTGPLFAFVARVCGGDEQALCAALEEAGYCVGAAYQLADDLLDLIGQEETAGKTLGTDHTREKWTLPEISQEGQRLTLERLCELCLSAVKSLEEYPKARQGLTEFLVEDVQPVLSRQLDVPVEISV